jgi:transglutaminase-like putative cysteine protease
MGTAQSAAVDRYFELSVLGLVSSGYLAVLGSGYLDVPTAALVALGLAVRALTVSGVFRLEISNRVTAGLTLGYIVFYLLDYLYLSRDFVTATVHLVFFLAVVKVLTAHATRDYVFLGVVGFLELLAASILSTNLTFFVFLTLFLVFGVAAFASAEVRRSMRKPRHLARAGMRNFPWRLALLTVSMSLGILVLTGGLFFLLPRTAQAAFRHLVPQRYHLPGFSNEMTLGEIGEIQRRQTGVMHVRIGDGRRPGGLKWRGTALVEFDGRRWFNPPDPGTLVKVNEGVAQLASLDQQRRRGERIRYEVQLGSMSTDALFLAGTPELLLINAPVVIRTTTGGYRAGFPNADGMRYGAYCFREDTAAPASIAAVEPPAAPRVDYLQLPRLDDRIAPLARSVTAGAGSGLARAEAIERHLRTEYRYTLKLLPREVPDPLAYFLFDRRQGHCEYFASAMAVMLRTIGIPSRVATGFESGVYNPVSGWYVIRASDAHSWVEAFLPGRGWTTFDPTPPVQDQPLLSFWSRLGFYIDAADTFWQEWVLSYNLDRQLTLASQMENSGRSFGSEWMDRVHGTSERWRAAAADFGRNYGAAAVLAMLLAAAAWWGGPRACAWGRAQARVRRVRQGQARAADATLLYGRMLHFLRRRGFEKPASMTPAEFVRVLPASATATLVGDFTSAYNDLRFGARPGSAARMVDLLQQLEHMPRK